jgi:CheY-like chemotaxis protein
VEVSDTGGGMDDDTQEKVFEPFFSTKFAGRGLGLAATLGIVRGHKGAIMLDSSPGEGTSVRVLLPVSTEGAIATRATEGAFADAEEWVGYGPVLLVDDEEAVRDTVKEMLERIGLPVLTASDGREAIDLFSKRSGEFSCVLLDFSMPYMDGGETLRELLRIRADVQVILSSGYGEQQIGERFPEEGIAAFIQKPYQIEVLEETLRTVLRPGDAESPGY